MVEERIDEANGLAEWLRRIDEAKGLAEWLMTLLVVKRANVYNGWDQLVQECPTQIYFFLPNINRW